MNTSHKPGSMVIRRATLEDADAIAELVEAAYTVYIPRMGQPPAPMLADYAEVINRSEVWVADQDGLVGVIVIDFRMPCMHIDNVAVEPHSQGCGIGTALLDFAEQRGIDSGCSESELYTNEIMIENLRLYRARGYQEVSRQRQHGYSRVFLRNS
jgi:ribosomal protein S18 acetylase RimI-like enzyme